MPCTGLPSCFAISGSPVQCLYIVVQWLFPRYVLFRSVSSSSKYAIWLFAMLFVLFLLLGCLSRSASCFALVLFSPAFGIIYLFGYL